MGLDGSKGEKIRAAIEQFGKNLKRDIATSSPFDKTKNGFVTKVTPIGYTVRIENKEYPNVQAIEGAIIRVGDVVVCQLPNNQMSQMYIIGKKVNSTSGTGGGGDASNTTVTFTEATTRENISTGEKLSVLFGKIKKWFTDLKAHAFTAPSTSQNTSTTTVPSDKLLTESSFRRVYKSLTEVNSAWTSAISFVTFFQYIITNSLTNSYFIIPNENKSSFTDAPQSYGQLEVVTGTNTLRMLATYNVEVGTTNSRFYRANIIRDGNTVTSINWLEIVDTTKLSNPNLLINSNFAINQRGQSSYMGAGYTVDRCRILTSSASVTVTPLTQGVKVAVAPTTQYTGQRCFEYWLEENDTKKILGKTVTFSMGIAALDKSVRVRFIIDGTTITTQTINANATQYSYTFTVPSSGSNLKISLLNNSAGFTLDILHWKLEIGDSATTYTPPLLAEELPKCQRYYQKINNGVLFGVSWSAGYIAVNYFHIVEMRTTPTLIMLAPVTMRTSDVNYTQTSATSSASYRSPIGGVAVLSTFPTNTPANGAFYISQTNKDVIAFDAEIY